MPQGSSANSSFVPQNIHCSANRSTFVSKGPIMGMSSLSLFRRMSFSYEIDSIFAQEFYNPAGFCICINSNPEFSSDVFEGNTALKFPVVHQGSVTCRYLHLSSRHCYYFAARHGLICVGSPSQCEALALIHPSQLAAERRRKGTGEIWPSKVFPEGDKQRKISSIYHLHLLHLLLEMNYTKCVKFRCFTMSTVFGCDVF